MDASDRAARRRRRERGPHDGQWQRLRAIWPEGPIDDDRPVTNDDMSRRVVLGHSAVIVIVIGIWEDEDMTSTHVSLGPINVALVASRRETRATLRVWTQRRERRRGAWLLARLCPFRITAGRDATVQQAGRL